MAVYTKISKKDISLINKKFNVENFKSFKGIKQGIENTNYLLKSKNNKFILTIFEKRVLKKEIPFFMKLMDQLISLNIIVPGQYLLGFFTSPDVGIDFFVILVDNCILGALPPVNILVVY